MVTASPQQAEIGGPISKSLSAITYQGKDCRSSNCEYPDCQLTLAELPIVTYFCGVTAGCP